MPTIDPPIRDYALTGPQGARAVEAGLSEADWYRSPVPPDELRRLLTRRDGPAIFHTILWFGLLGVTGWATWHWWGSWWAIPPYALYAVLYATASDSRWHECSHGTAFASDRLNDLVYEIASFMIMRESVVWRWSHNRHHSDTIIIGRDPEIQVPRPTRFLPLILGLANLGNYASYPRSLVRHAAAIMTPAERTFVPASEFTRVFRNARIVLGIYAAVIACAVALHSWVPIFLVVIPHLFGTWLMIVHNTTQHAGLAENVLDHRRNCRTVHMNWFSRFVYWNMNYHVEHHMFPLIPYHALPRLHALIKDDCPPAYPSLWAAWREILPALRRQAIDPDYVVERPVPAPAARPRADASANGRPDSDGWIEVGAATDLQPGDARRVDVGRRTYVIARDAQGSLHALDGLCTHGNAHLADGLVHGGLIECPKHNGRFALADGSPARAPICRGLATYPLEERAGRLWLHATRPGGAGVRPQRTWRFTVVSSRCVTPFIKELVLAPSTDEPRLAYTPGDYLQFDIPPYADIPFRGFDIPAHFRAAWDRDRLFDLVARHPGPGRRNNYSMASDPMCERDLRLIVRLAVPPAGRDAPPGVGSAYMFSLRPGDAVSAIGPFGDFHPRPTGREMVYIGGGAGMAPMRAHIAHLLEGQGSRRRISFWYGARSRQDVFYADYFADLSRRHGNFRFQVALSQPSPEDAWTGPTGFIHEVVRETYLADHPDPQAIEFYLCGPPPMIAAATRMLADIGVAPGQIAYDEF